MVEGSALWCPSHEHALPLPSSSGSIISPYKETSIQCLRFYGYVNVISGWPIQCTVTESPLVFSVVNNCLFFFHWFNFLCLCRQFAARIINLLSERSVTTFQTSCFFCAWRPIKLVNHCDCCRCHICTESPFIVILQISFIFLLLIPCLLVFVVSSLILVELPLKGITNLE